MTLAQFQVFVAIVDAGSFTEAAKALGMTQSSVSQAIASLEAELGVSLLTRGREGVSLTEIGARLITHVREVLNRAERQPRWTARRHTGTRQTVLHGEIYPSPTGGPCASVPGRPGPTRPGPPLPRRCSGRTRGAPAQVRRRGARPRRAG